MSTYDALLRVFEELGVRSDRDLEDLLIKSREFGNWEEKLGDVYAGKAELEEDRVASAICRALADIATKMDSLYQGGGIKQFSLYDQPRIAEEDLKKALLLSSTVTLFTGHEFKVVNKGYVSDLGDEFWGQEWHISHDFIRELFRRRELARRGALILLPASVKYAPGYVGGYGAGEVLPLLEEIQTTKVIGLAMRPRVIDSILAQYRKNRQLVSLPELEVPWVENVDMEAILRIRDENGDQLQSVQRAYHQALLTQIEMCRSVDFASISRQVNEDVLLPELRNLEKRYRRTLSMHRRLTLAGGAVAFFPLTAAVLSGTIFSSLSAGQLATTVSPPAAALVGGLAINLIMSRAAKEALDDERFYILWRLGRSHPPDRNS